MAEEERLSTYEMLVKNYLDKQSETDTALKSLYAPSKINDCFKYITGLAREQAVNNCAMIEDSQVFKWARDYYLEVLPKEADKKTVEIVKKTAEMAEKLDNAVKKADECSSATKEVLEKADNALKQAEQMCFDF